MPSRSLERRCAPVRAVLAAALLALGCGGGSTPLPPVDVSHVAAADPGSALPAGWSRGPFMEIFVRAYRDSDGDGIGDLRGLTEKLDYLQDLGVTGIWLMPITPSEDRDHGYAVADYRGVDRDYGTLADLAELLAAAHARGIGVILDYVMNHSAATNPLFVRSSASDGDFRGWYTWSSSHPNGWWIYDQDPWRIGNGGYYYAPFWDQMPDFDLVYPPVAVYHQDNLRLWLNRGVDGFRFDAVGNLVENGPSAWEDQPQSYALMEEVRALVAGYANRYMVCEAPADPIGFGAETACGSAFAFGHQADVVRAALGDPAAVEAVAAYFAPGRSNMATMVSNHDRFAGQRLWDQVRGDEARYRLAAATYLLQPGIPFIYYGEEVGMAGGAGLSGDPALRTPMSWTADARGFTSGAPFRALSGNVGARNAAAEVGVPGSLHSFYKDLIALRRAYPALAEGGYADPQASGATLAFGRALEGAHALVVLNYGATAAAPVIRNLPAGTTLLARYPPGAGDLTVDGAGQATVSVPATSFVVFTY